MSTQRIQRCNFGKTDVLGSVSHVPRREKELKHSSVAVNVRNCVPQKRKLLQKSVKFMTISYSATSYVIHVIYSTSYFPQSPQLQKTTTSDHANITDCFQNVLHVSLMLILYTEIFIVTFIIDCAVTTIFTISLSWLRFVNLFYLINEYVCVCVCDRHESSRGLFATAELLVTICYEKYNIVQKLNTSIHVKGKDKGGPYFRRSVGGVLISLS